MEFAQTPDAVLDPTIVFQTRVWERHELRIWHAFSPQLDPKESKGIISLEPKFAVEARA